MKFSKKQDVFINEFSVHPCSSASYLMILQQVVYLHRDLQVPAGVGEGGEAGGGTPERLHPDL